MEQAQIEEAIQLSLALENSLSQTEIEAQKRALAAFEAQNAFSDSFGVSLNLFLFFCHLQIGRFKTGFAN